MNLVVKIGSGLVVVILVGMLALTFSGRNTRDINFIDILLGRSAIGSFNGENISTRMYSLADQNCRERYQQLVGGGRIPEQLMTRCIASQLREVYILPKVAKDLGLDVSPSSIEKAALERARLNFKKQSSLAAEDRMTLGELYRRELAYAPVDVQVRYQEAQRAFEKLAKGMPYPEAAVRAEELATKITMDVKFVRYTTADLLAELDDDVTITEEQIKKRFDEEQGKLSESQRKPYKDEREFVKNRVKSELKQLELAKVKEKLSKLPAGSSLEDVAKITGVKVHHAEGVTLEGLSAVKVDQGEVAKLNLPAVLADLKGSSAVSGPHQEGDHTVYLMITNVRVPDLTLETAKLEKMSEEKGQRAGMMFLSYIMEEQASHGRFRVRARGSLQDNSQQEIPEIPAP